MCEINWRLNETKKYSAVFLGFFVLDLEIILVRGLVKLVPAVAYHFGLNLPAAFSQPRTSIISGPSIRLMQTWDGGPS